MKKTLIICGTIVLVAIIALAAVLVLKSDGMDKGGYDDKALRELPDMTYEEFTKGMSADLSREVQAEVDMLYEQYQDADQQRRAEIFRELKGLGIYEAKELGEGKEFEKGDRPPIDKK